ncbi:periaxin-like [Leguminivora glycinivorella]|uniref:periaxin-like n=1 Tax=Leguminivora glycinivorella TaxID=1035111 RepID=UPI00200DF94C|nr:periaxin-like [Leguminivora glycinivorella]
MKLLLLTLFVAVGFANPIPTDPSGDAVEVVVNGLAEGEALEIGHIVDVKVKEIVDGEVAAVSNALHPFTAQGLAEAAAIAEAEQAAAVPAIPEVIVPEPIVIPEPVQPEVIPAPIVLPEPSVPEVVLPEPAVPEVIVPEPIVLPEPAVPEVIVPEPIVLPEPAVPEVVPEPIIIPEPAVPEVVVPEPEPVAVVDLPEVADAPQVNGEVFNNGIVSITVNTPEDAGVMATLSSWVSMMVNYVHSGIAYTQQLI